MDLTAGSKDDLLIPYSPGNRPIEYSNTLMCLSFGECFHAHISRQFLNQMFHLLSRSFKETQQHDIVVVHSGSISAKTESIEARGSTSPLSWCPSYQRTHVHEQILCVTESEFLHLAHLNICGAACGHVISQYTFFKSYWNALYLFVCLFCSMLCVSLFMLFLFTLWREHRTLDSTECKPLREDVKGTNNCRVSFLCIFAHLTTK